MPVSCLFMPFLCPFMRLLWGPMGPLCRCMPWHAPRCRAWWVHAYYGPRSSLMHAGTSSAAPRRISAPHPTHVFSCLFHAFLCPFYALLCVFYGVPWVPYAGACRGMPPDAGHGGFM